MATHVKPVIRVLNGGDAQALLARNRVVAALRRLLPSTLTEDDPTPSRNVVFGVHASEISGRCSVSGETLAALAPA